MDTSWILLTVLALLLGVTLVELASAVLPMLIVIGFVPRAERQDLAMVLASADSSKRLRVWPALRTAVQTRRAELAHAKMAHDWRGQCPPLINMRAARGEDRCRPSADNISANRNSIEVLSEDEKIMSKHDYVRLVTVHADSTSDIAEAAELKLIAAICGGGSCPSVYRTNRGTVVVQGRIVTASMIDVDLEDDEALVEIPEELLVRLNQVINSDERPMSQHPEAKPQ
jgi:hypothetical protein